MHRACFRVCRFDMRVIAILAETSVQCYGVGRQPGEFRAKNIECFVDFIEFLEELFILRSQCFSALYIVVLNVSNSAQMFWRAVHNNIEIVLVLRDLSSFGVNFVRMLDNVNMFSRWMNQKVHFLS